MKKHQYKIISVHRSKAEKVLNDLGIDGWELCGTILEGYGENATIYLFLKKET